MKAIEWLGLSAADFCNLNCKYCFISAKREGTLLDYSKATTFLEFFSDYARPNTKITFTGGEPTIHPRLLDMVDFAQENFTDPRIVVGTNGVLSERLLNGFLKRDAKGDNAAIKEHDA